MFIEGLQDSNNYFEVVRDGVLPCAPEVFGEVEGWTIQQDNAPIHSSKISKQWLSSHFFTTLPWPPKSSNIKIIENMCVIMVRNVYARGKHYANVEDLKISIEEAWCRVGSDLLLKFYKSLPRVMHAVMDARDGATNYKGFSSFVSYGSSHIYINCAICFIDILAMVASFKNST